jgi:hypothetical protein
LKAPGIKLQELKYGKPVSKFGFKFNLRRYTMAEAAELKLKLAEAEARSGAAEAASEAGAYTRPLLSST